ncbi:hypothetical protein MQE22_08675 [Acidithiobacillus sp. YTS05]|nr:hypothetical protein MQE22_08675 [Acidithiobacillus sp. YTS05]
MPSPEPKGYTLANAAEKWEVSLSTLLRLGAEGKLELAWPVPGSMFVSVFSEESHAQPETIEDLEQLLPGLSFDQLSLRMACRADDAVASGDYEPGKGQELASYWKKQRWVAIELAVAGWATISRQSLEYCDKKSGVLESSTFSRVSHFSGAENTILSEPPLPGLPWRYEIRKSNTRKGGPLPPLPERYYFEGRKLIELTELIIPSSEVCRIEGRSH